MADQSRLKLSSRPGPAPTPVRFRRSRPTWKPILVLAVVLGALVMFFPFLWTLVTSVSPGAGLTATPKLIPDQLSWSAYLELFRNTPFARVTLNSLGLAVVVTGLQLTTSSMAAYVFSRLPFPGRGVVFACYLATMMVPMQVLMVPLFVQMRDLHLVDNYLGVVLPSMASAFGVFLLRQAMNSVPRELDEAARIDGAGHLRIFGRIVLPLVGPALATLTVFSFMSSWNAFLWPLVILRSPQLKTLPLALASMQGQYTTQWDVMMAGSVISILPMLAIYLFAQKYVIQGVASTGIK
ncbi:MAG: carbohydrate ABC transporter permease [Propionibacteriaceae bacterium]|jgi:multiple sugar transport system permease protein|nr:carbohydrate ABC transporter permease [Propionibacteriaceae bacterium]